MCGIAGLIDFAGRPIETGLLERLCSCLAHRGPDDRGTWVYQGAGWSAGLAHTRLAVIDPAPEAHQPMLSRDGQWAIAYNGELYNYRALRERLARPLATTSDTEVMLEACRAWGPEVLTQCDGMWAMAVVDAAGQVGHLSRDPMGIKPLYYASVDGRLLFASEMRGIVQLQADLGLGSPEIDPEAMACYLQLGFIPHPMTIYRGIRKLPPGHVLRFDRRGPAEPERYFRLSEPMGRVDYTEACGEVRRLVEQAVMRQCVADVPLGAFLSGGMDSSIVVACMAGRGGGRVRTFSIGYAGHPRYDETAYARQVARHLGTDHQEFRLTFQDVLAVIEPMLDHLGEPFADSSLLPTSLVSHHTRKHVTVALSGDGGDELFGGYWRYAGHYYLERYRRLPGLLRRGMIEPLLGLVPDARSSRRLDRFRQLRKLLRGDLPDPLDRHLAWARFLEEDLAAQLISASRARGADEAIRRLYREGARQWRNAGAPPVQSASLDPILLADLAVSLPADMLFKVDTASMYHALEVRVPLLSADVVNFVAGLPSAYKVRGAEKKRILRDAFRERLPDAVFARPKMGFEVPIGEFLRNELRGMFASTVTPDALARLGIAPAPVARAYDDHLHRRRDRTELLWALLVLCRWSTASA
jgi:asparagine synthase (glutamine-hydrolysing)